jgi:hypothetical protein
MPVSARRIARRTATPMPFYSRADSAVACPPTRPPSLRWEHSLRRNCYGRDGGGSCTRPAQPGLALRVMRPHTHRSRADADAAQLRELQRRHPHSNRTLERSSRRLPDRGVDDWRATTHSATAKAAGREMSFRPTSGNGVYASIAPISLLRSAVATPCQAARRRRGREEEVQIGCAPA